MASGVSEGSNSRKREWDEGKPDVQSSHVPYYGNFRNYSYIHRGAARDVESQDPRLAPIMDWLKSSREAKVTREQRLLKRILDIGCNDGAFTLQFSKTLHEETEKVIGVDIDGELILKAERSARHMNLHSSRRDVSDSPSAGFMPRVLGSGRRGNSRAKPRPRLQLGEDVPVKLPLAVRFLHSDWVFNDEFNRSRVKRCPQDMSELSWSNIDEVAKEDRLGYDLILALSVTKWIHLHYYDAGLRRFFARIATSLKTNGILILEPQPFNNSYKSNLKLFPKGSQARKNFYALRVMPDDFEWILTCELGLRGPFRIRAKGNDCEFGASYTDPC
jgi:7SK snRNA methylphosphate capping enzyme